MEHVDEETLALVALGETVADADRAHVDGCARCTAEVAELAAVVAVGRAARPGDTLVAPPAGVWDRVRAELDLPAGLRPDGQAPAAPTAASAPAPATGGGAPVTVLAERRRPRTAWIAAAAAAGVVVGGAGATLVPRLLDPAGAEAEVVAEATLDPLPGWEATGEAVVEVAADGSRVLVLTVDEQDGDDGFREVWLIDREVTRLVSLGVLTGSEGRFTVPDGLDLDDFAVVDVSEEPFDGDPAHSGDSIVRGVLDV
ncbi:anti-sigma factor [Actinotalea solisilvae]|uniref:anti-sigma factor n=1 Tax=Actinotalea solisilvae TaxID=2072922 RepID=UPI0018F15B20|nr:anti-sigma factor [Actinotalea solisilvae]